MSSVQVAWNPTTKVVKLQTEGDAVGAGFTDIGSFNHHSDVADQVGIDANHAYYHHVRDMLYALGFEDMSVISIEMVPLTEISSVIADDTLANAATSQITNTFTPATASDRRVTYSTSNAAVATVSASGLVTAGATDGTAIITVTSEYDPSINDTITVTVS